MVNGKKGEQGVLTKVQLILIRNGFSVEHVYMPLEAMTKHAGFHFPAPKRSVEIGHFDGACAVLIALVHENIQEQPSRKAKWLIDVVFSFGKNCNFATGQDIHIHVMGSLSALINASGQLEA
jgi:hypothetical protein